MDTIHPHELFVPASGAPSRTIVDVRSPGEVDRGSIPGSVTLPILDDAERHAVGLAYATTGSDEATEVGRRLTEHDMDRRAAAWRRAARSSPSAFMCWRGGLRSALAQRFADVPGTPRVEGGYKAVRAYLMGAVATALARRTTWVVTGPTGSGKTDLLTALGRVPDLLALDLEAAAGHRGSAFGATSRQPAQATFDHRLAVPLVVGLEPWLLLEDESRSIGAVRLPDAVFDRVRSAPLLVLEAPVEERIARIHAQYAAEPARRVGPDATRTALVTAIGKLRRRLGGATTDRLTAQIDAAHDAGAWDDVEAFAGVIGTLLREYYDPAYRRSTPVDDGRTVVRGTRTELASWIDDRMAFG